MACADPTGPLVIIGNPNTVFVQRHARCWREMGHEVVVVTTSRIWAAGDRLPDGTRVIAVDEPRTRLMARELTLLGPILRALERELMELPDPTREAAHDGWGRDKPLPSIVPAVGDAVVIADAVRRLRPRVVFGHEAFAYGLATALCYGANRALMVWGGDVQLFADASPVARALMRFALQSVETVVAGTAGLCGLVESRFGVPHGRTLAFSFGVDRRAFRPVSTEQRRAARVALGLRADDPVVMSVRRFDPCWGSEAVLEVIATIAAREPRAQFVVLGGSGNEGRLAGARVEAVAQGYGDRLRLIEGQVPIDRYAELLRAADVGLSLVPASDEPLSWSVLQGMATGIPMVVSDQQVYREVAARGGGVVVVERGDPDAAATALRNLLSDDRRRESLTLASQTYLDRYEDQPAALTRLLERIECPTGGSEPALRAAG